MTFIPPESLKGRDNFKTATNPSLNCPKHIVNSGSVWFCTECGTNEYCQYEHGYNDMVLFISKHKDCCLKYPKALFFRAKEVETDID